MVCVNGADLDSQIAWVRECCEAIESPLEHRNIHQIACERNGSPGYGPIESEFLFCFIAAKRPHRIIQIGAGVSTAVILEAASVVDYKPDITCVDPYPTAYLKSLAARGNIRLLAKRCQDVEIGAFNDLESGDLLFVDSSHAVKPGGEVNQIILEILPRLATGCYVHFHDIYFPYDYQASLLNTVFFSEESTLLHAFLVNNSRYSIAGCLSMLHHGKSEELQRCLPNYRPSAMDKGLRAPSASGHFPSAAYLEVIA